MEKNTSETLSKIDQMFKEDEEERIKERIEIFIAGAEMAIEMIGGGMDGGSGRSFNTHCYQIKDIIKKLKEKNNIE